MLTCCALLRGGASEIERLGELFRAVASGYFYDSVQAAFVVSPAPPVHLNASMPTVAC